MSADFRSQNAEVNKHNAQGTSRNSELDLKTRTRQFAIRIVHLYKALPHSEEFRVIGRQQLFRSGTSVGANYRASCRARSKAEFIAKLGIVLEEAGETVFWLELLPEMGVVPSKTISALTREANELVSIFVASLKTAKGQ